MYSQIIARDCLGILQKNDFVKFIKGKGFLITGSNGLIGNYFTTLLDVANKEFNTNAMVYCISKHKPQWVNNTFVFRTEDLYLSHNSLTFKTPVDYIIHAACYARPRLFGKNELETISLNVDVTRDLLQIAQEEGADFLFLSSSEIYGNAIQVPTPEKYTDTFPTSSIRGPYVESKRLGEVLCHIYHRWGINTKVARLSLLYGPGLSIQDERVIGDFMRQGLIDGCISLLDSGSKIRTYCYIADGIKILLNILFQGKDIVYNVGGIETVSVLDLAKIIACECGATCEIGVNAGIADAPDIVKLDISKVQQEFGIGDFLSLGEGIKRTIAWNKEVGYVH